MYFEFEPEVAGGFGGRTTFADRRARPPKIEHFHYEVEGWLGDALLEAVGCFIITSSMASVLQSEGLTGFELGSVEVTTSEEFKERDPGRALPEFRWFKITGSAGRDDFGLNDACRLIVSQRVLDVLQQRGPLKGGTYEPLSS